MCNDEKLCCISGNPFEGLSAWWVEGNSTIPPCFQHTVLMWAPCAVFFLTVPLEIKKLLNARREVTEEKRLSTDSIKRRRYLFLARLISLFLLLICSVVRLSAIGRIEHPIQIIIASFTLQPLTLILIIVISILRHFRLMAPPSGYTWTALLMFILFGIPELISSIYVAMGMPSFGATMFFLQYASLLLSLVMFSISDLVLEKDSCQWPEEFVSFPNFLIFWWFWGILIKGYRNVLTMNDIFAVSKEEQTSTVYKAFEKQLRKEFGDKPISEKSKNQPGDWAMTKVLVKAFYKPLMLGGILQGIDALLTFVGPVVITLLMRFIRNPDEPLWHGLVYVGILLGVTQIRSFAKQYSWHYLNKMGVRARAATVAAVYRKALTMSSEARRISNTGEIVNLMAVDSTRFIDMAPVLHSLWSAPLQVVLGLYFIYLIVGHAVWAGIIIMGLILVCTMIVSKYMQKMQMKQLEEKDKRMKLLSEMLSGMKVVKLYAWETAFERLIENIRARELKFLKINYWLFGFFEVSFCCTHLLSCTGIFGLYSVLNPTLNMTAEVVFVVITVFNIIYIPFTNFPWAVSNCMMTLASVRRLRKYFCGADLIPYVENQQQSDAAVTIDNGSFAWESDAKECTLRDINLAVKPGQLVAIVGSVGSGKSSLINALCGEMQKRNGSVSINGTVAYVAQQAWIQNLTVRDNILFGLPYDERRYQKIVQACALKPDFALLANGDMTIIGEKGSNLSGGQKQRISLARAVYQDANIYLLDDPLSAVDVHVGKTIFDGVIGPGGLLKKKARVFVTHGIHYLPLCDNIVLMGNGKFIASGTFDKLAEKHEAYADFLEQHLMPENTPNREISMSISTHSQSSRQRTISGGQEIPASEIILDRLTSLRHSQASVMSEKRKSIARAVDAEEEDFQEEEEEVHVGRIGWKTYWFYIRHAGVSILLMTIFIVFSELSYMGGALWLEKWTDTGAVPLNGTTIENENGISSTTGIGILGLFAGLQFITTTAFCIFFVHFLMRASTRIHKLLLTKILRAPMSFFDTTPSGRLNNRFGKDTNTLDNQIPFSTNSVIHFLIVLVAFMIPMFYATPIFSIVLIPLLFIYMVCQKFYATSSTQFRRLEAVTRSPIYSHFQESINGISTIRAYRQQNRFAGESDRLVDANDSAQMSLLASYRWLGYHLDFIGNLVVTGASLSAVLSRSSMLPGLVGLSVSYALGITDLFNWGIREMSMLETEVVALERIKEYMETPPEAEWTSNDSKITKNWLSRGGVEFSKYSTSYRPGLPLVLRDFQCRIRPGEKVGVVGRTGAGKSSLTLALFRLIEPTEGTILIDGLDITQLGLHDLRKNLTIIPQEPVLFSGTMRQNIDPFEEYADSDLYRALELSHLTKFVASLDGGLSHEIDEGGDNLSVGQRQLLCLARALLRKSKILVLDEATASVDVETDALIQRTVKEQFADCTVITIAHRLNTILDYDRIMVLESGRLIEFGNPASLIENERSEFGRMIQEAGIRVSSDDLKFSIHL